MNLKKFPRMVYALNKIASAIHIIESAPDHRIKGYKGKLVSGTDTEGNKFPVLVTNYTPNYYEFYRPDIDMTGSNPFLVDTWKISPADPSTLSQLNAAPKDNHQLINKRLHDTLKKVSDLEKEFMRAQIQSAKQNKLPDTEFYAREGKKLLSETKAWAQEHLTETKEPTLTSNLNILYGKLNKFISDAETLGTPPQK